MTDEHTRGGIRRKRPDYGNPDDAEAKFARVARIERKVRLRIPLREQIAIEGVHGDLDGTTADIRERERDSRIEKKANIRDRENETYAVRRERVMEEWADKAERKERRERGRSIIEARQESIERRNAMLEGEMLPELKAMSDIAKPEALKQVIAKEDRIARHRPKKAPPLAKQIEEHGEDAVPDKYRSLVAQTRTSGTSKRAK